MRPVKSMHLLFCAEVLYLILSAPSSRLHAETVSVLRAGITREINNFDTGSSSTVLRSGASFSIDDMFSFNATAMRESGSGNLTGTWFIHAAPGDGCFSFILGDYSLHFGSGLLMGKKEYLRPDPFSRRASFTRDSLFSGSQSGNPAYSFSGIISSVRTGNESFRFQLTPFYSIQRRFISEQQAYERSVSSSLMTLNLKTSEDGIYNSPADIINFGAIADTSFMELFRIQVYGFSTRLQAPGGKPLLWEKTSLSQGTERTSSFGIFAEYSDSSISMFAEPVSSVRTGPGWSVHGESVAWGVSLRNRIFGATLNGKFSDRNFRSVYASGDSGPENILDFYSSVAIGEHLKTGASFYCERDLTVNPGSDERRCFIREEVQSSLTGFRILGADFRFSRKLPLDSGCEGKARQLSCLLNIAPVSSLWLRARGSGQFSDAGSSWLWGAEFKLMFLSCFSLSAGYTGIYAVRDNAMYAAVTPASENNMDIGRFTGKGSGWSVKIKYSNEKDSFFFRWCRINDGRGIDQNLESALVLVF